MQAPVAITMGCPAGIGPEITLRFLARRPEGCVVVGDLSVLERAARELAIRVDLVGWRPGEPLPAGRAAVYSLTSLADGLAWGEPDAQCGRAAGLFVETAARLVLDGLAAAVVTCPLAKEFLNLGGYAFPGHTEMLADICGSRNFGMMMAGRDLRVALATIHVPLARVPASLTVDEVARVVSLTRDSLARDFAVSSPRIAVAGLNPHAGESGMFGDEEGRVIAPAVERAGGPDGGVHGPLPPDTVFARAASGAYDAVVAMYHDQGLIPFKLLHFSDGVNVTMGLPIVRTSVDHGTAYDIAGRGVASEASLAAAFDLAVAIAANRAGGAA